MQESWKGKGLKWLPFIGMAILLAAAIALNAGGDPKKPIGIIPIAPIEFETEQTPTPQPITTELEQNRIKYGIPIETFANLPTPPFDFYARKEQFETKRLQFSYLSEDYWLQPEFYQNFEGGLLMMQNYPTDRVARSGYGTYPAEQIANVPANEKGEITVNFIVKASWGVVTYQGFSTAPAYPTNGELQLSAFPDGTKQIETQNAKYVKENVKITILTDKDFVIEPSFSFWNIKEDGNTTRFEVKDNPQIERGWAKMVSAKIEIAPMEAGKYIVGIDLTPPSDKFRNDAVWKYSRLYEDGGSFSPGRPWYSLFLYVN